MGIVCVHHFSKLAVKLKLEEESPKLAVKLGGEAPSLEQKPTGIWAGFHHRLPRHHSFLRNAVQHHNQPQSSQYYLKHAMLKYNVNMLRIHPLMFEAEI